MTGCQCMYLYLWTKKKDEKIWILKGGIKYLIINVKIWNWFWRTNELKEKIENIEEEIRQLDLDIEENQGKFKGKLMVKALFKESEMY